MVKEENDDHESGRPRSRFGSNVPEFRREERRNPPPHEEERRINVSLEAPANNQDDENGREVLVEILNQALSLVEEGGEIPEDAESHQEDHDEEQPATQHQEEEDDQSSAESRER
eukprot:CAMPEP_0172471496 /NCGR_PEP_ID=MMETSP1065-20121228/67850_1 /TAXON_ID=265537 /ORGANISM="Amphiprora paludosa, Strain CCMP125" /LENGTH=114 /DNA_ID=CAMNT_0013229599 /DNA_START=61 /DNA_END=405 /DNA_ORIENTATION=+